MPFRLRVLSLVCLFAVLVSAQVLAQSNRASFVGHRVRASKMAGPLTNPPTSGLNFAAASVFSSGGNGANAAAVADLNGDGRLDMVVTNWCSDGNCTSGSVEVLLQNPDGTFTPTVYGSGGLFADSVAVADLGNGHPDLVVANCGSNSNTNCLSTTNSGNVAVLIGNGNGTFLPAVTYPLGAHGATSVALADVNGDNKLDLVVATGDFSGGLVGVLLGNGDGTFQAEVTYNSGGVSALSVAVADVNGDGHPDVVVANQCSDSTCTSSNVGVLLNNGSGAFGTAATFDSGGLFTDWVAIADVNGDSKPDLLVANSSTSSTVDLGNVGVLLGNGDGTFKTAVTYPSGAFGAASVAVADVNGDGKQDLVVANCSGTASSCVGSVAGDVAVLLGNGNGTFQTAVTYGSGAKTPFAVTVGDVNGDGKPDIVAANCASNTCGAAPGTVGLLINTSLTATATALVSSPNPSNFGQSVAFTAKVTAQPGFDKGTPTGTVSFFDSTTKIGTSTLNSGTAILMTSALAVGAHSITATYSGDSNFATSTSPALQQVVDGAIVSLSPTSLNFGNQAIKIAGTPQAVTLKNTGDVNLTITSIQITGANSGDFGQKNNCPASLTPNSTCQITVTFTPAAAGARSAAVSVTDNAPGSPQSVPLTGVGVQASVTTNLTVSPSTALAGASVTFTAKLSSTVGTPPDGETVTFKDTTTNKTLGSPAPLSKGTATLTSKTLLGGTYSVVASYPGDATFQASTSTPAQALNVQDFALTANPNMVTVSAPGQGGSTTIDITTLGGLKATSLTGWTCSGLPSKSNCTFGTVGSNNQVSVSISTTASSALSRPMFGHHQQLFYAMLLPGFLGMFSLAGRKRTVRGLRLLAMIVVLGLAALWVACGGGSSSPTPPPTNPGTPTGNSTVTVTATSGTLQHTTTFTLAVQ